MAIAVAATLTGCGGGSDNPALPAPSTLERSAPDQEQTGPAVSLIVVKGAEIPQLAGEGAVNLTIRRAAEGLPSGCTPTTELDSSRLASFVWRCPGGRQTAATVTLPLGHLLVLAELLNAPGRAYLSSVASTQFQAAGISNATTSDIGTWFIAPATLDVIFPAGVISYPLASLGPYIARSSGYGTLLQGT